MKKVDSLGGTGGLLSHAPRRIQAMMMLIDGFGLEGITKVFVDSVFMMPHLGVLSSVYRKAALDIFEKDCLVRLGTCIALSGTLNKSDDSKEIGSVMLKLPSGKTLDKTLLYGTMMKIPLDAGETAEVDVRPDRQFDAGAGPGKRVTKTIEGGIVGIILDGRGRPLELPEDDNLRIERLTRLFVDLEVYPKSALKQQSEA
jgi:hypothetical protein